MTASNHTQVTRGAFVTTPQGGPVTVIEFAYNPGTLRRALTPRLAGATQARSRAVRYVGAPTEIINMEVSLDDTIERTNNKASTVGVRSRLAALELLTYPSLDQVKQNERDMSQGQLEISPPLAPPTYLVWGVRRVQPVEITAMTVVEQLFDPNLNPIRAMVSLTVRVLSYSDLMQGTHGYDSFVSYQSMLVQSAETAVSHSLSGTGVTQV